MNCDMNQELLTGYIDGELAPAEREALEKHLPECGSCRQELEELRDLVGMVKGLPVHPVPASIAGGVRKEITPPGAKVHSFSKRKWSWVEWALSAAAVLFVAVNVIYVASIPSGVNLEMQSKAPDEVAYQDTAEPEDAHPPMAVGKEKVDFGRNLEKQSFSKGMSGRTNDQAQTVDDVVKTGKGEQKRKSLELNRSSRGGNPEFLTVQTSNISTFRTDFEKSLQEQKISFEPGAGSLGHGVYARKNCLLVELTAEQLAALRKKLGADDNVLVRNDGYGYFSRRNRQERSKPDWGKAPKVSGLGKDLEEDERADENKLALLEPKNGDKPLSLKDRQKNRNSYGDNPGLTEGGRKAPGENRETKKTPSNPESPAEKDLQNGKNPSPTKKEPLDKKVLKEGEKPSREKGPAKIRVVIYFVEKK